MQKKLLRRKKRRQKLLIQLVILLVLMAGSFYFGYRMGGTKPVYTGEILLVNSENTLSDDYVPEGLVNLYEVRHSFRLASSDIYMTYEAYQAMEDMFAQAEAENVNGFIITSGYRSYDRQKEIYQESEPGYAQMPGASEHQTGLAFDVTAQNSGEGFESTAQYAWLRKNAHKYGFIQRYPSNKSHITGISYEPWHYRYVGTEAATIIYKNNLTLEEFLD
ncbi:MAG: M15 family metallopeptidase [Clostridia bacterium]|nr:M15 family metallopeptidase [Clostridia bacterium]